MKEYGKFVGDISERKISDTVKLEEFVFYYKDVDYFNIFELETKDSPIREVHRTEFKELLKTHKTKDGLNLFATCFPLSILSIKRSVNITSLELKHFEDWIRISSSAPDAIWGTIRDTLKTDKWKKIATLLADQQWTRIKSNIVDENGWKYRVISRSSIWEVIGAMIPSLYRPNKRWKYHEKTKGNPFQCCIDLVNAGLVPSFDGRIWRLHTGPSMETIFKQTLA